MQAGTQTAQRISYAELLARIDSIPDEDERERAYELALDVYGDAPQPDQRAGGAFAEYRFEPAKYITDKLGWQAWDGDNDHPGQVQILDAYVLALRQQHERRDFEDGKIKEDELQYWHPGDVIQNRIRIEAGHNTGKTKIASGLVSHFFDSFPSIILTFAPTWEQIKDLLWKEIKTDRDGKSLPGKVLDTCEIKHSANHFAKGRATNNSNGQGTERIHGQHHPYLMFVLDEAEGVDDYVFDAIDSMASGGIAIILLLANPRTRTSRFYRAKDESNVINFRISCLDHPNVRDGRETIPGAVTRHYVEGMLDKHCEVVEEHDPDEYTFTIDFAVTHQRIRRPAGTIFRPNPVFLYRVRGVPPPNVADKTLVPVGRYEAACKREPVDADATRAYMGIDVARFGLDYGTLYVKWNGRAWRAGQFFKQDTNDYRAKVKAVAKDLAAKGVKRLHIRVDGGGGFASGIVDPIKGDSEMTRLFEDFQVFEVHFNSDPKDKKSFDDAITEWTASAAESLKTLAVLNAPAQLLSDLCDREFKWVQRDDEDVKRLEKKVEFRKRRKPERSPDDGDGFVLAVAGEGLFKKPVAGPSHVGQPRPQVKTYQVR